MFQELELTYSELKSNLYICFMQLHEQLKLNILSHFDNLRMEEEDHVYYLKEKPLKISVSGVIKYFYKPFDAYKKSIEICGDNEEAVKLRETWSNAGDIACKLGTKVHLFGEVYPFNRHLKPKDGFEEAVVKFWNDLPDHIIPVMMECRMYHKEYMFAGTMDILLYDTIKDEYIIADYKTNKDLFKNHRGKKMTGVFRNFLDNPFNHYQLQLSLYQILLQQVPGIKVSSRKIIWLKDDGNYDMYDTQDLTEVLKEELKLKFAC